MPTAAHLLELCRYVVLNAVRAGLVKRPEEWRGSSYRATAGESKKPAFLEVDWVLSQFGRRRAEAKKAYRGYVLEGLQGKSPWETLKGQILLGTEDFLARLRERLRGKDLLKEVPRAQRYVARPTLEEIFKEKRGRREKRNDEVIYRAHMGHGYRMGEIADASWQKNLSSLLASSLPLSRFFDAHRPRPQDDDLRVEF